MDTTVNLRAKTTASESNVILTLWTNRRERVITRKKYELLIEEDNERLASEIKNLLQPVCKATGVPIEFIIESNRCVVQVRAYSIGRKTGESFVTYLSQSIIGIDQFMGSHKGLNTLKSKVKKAIKRIQTISKGTIAKPINPTKQEKSVTIADTKRTPDSNMWIVVTYNLRTRYDF